jgi:hypothetical protein
VRVVDAFDGGALAGGVIDADAGVPPLRVTVIVARLAVSLTEYWDALKASAPAVSLSAIVKTAVLWPPRAAPLGLDSVRMTVSFSSSTVSARIGTVKVRLVWPSAKVKTPVTVLKSTPTVAVPAPAV